MSQMSTSTNATRLFHLSGSESEGVKISKQIVSLHLSAPLLNLIQLTFEFPVHVSCAIVELWNCGNLVANLNDKANTSKL